MSNTPNKQRLTQDVPDILNPGKFLVAVWKRIFLVLAISAIGSASAYLYTSRQPNVYASQSSVLIEAPSTNAAEQAQTLRVDVTRAQAILAESGPVRERAEKIAGESFGPAPGSTISPTFQAIIDEQLLYFKVTDSQPERAARISDAWSQAFIEEMAERALSSKRAMRASIDRSMNEYKAEYDSKKTALEEYIKILGFDPGSADLQKNLELAGEINAKMSAKDFEIAALQVEKERAVATSATELLQTPRARADAGLQTLVQLNARQTESLRTQLLAAQQQYKPESPQIAALEMGLKDLVEQEKKLAAAFEKQIGLELEILRAERKRLEVRLAEITAQSERASKAVSEYKLLSADVAKARDVYEQLVTRRAQVDLSARFFTSYARQWESAQANPIPFSPNWRKNLIGGFFASFCAALALVALLELKDCTIRTAADIERKLGLPTTGMVPNLGRKLSGSDGYMLVHQQPNSFAADCLRNIHIGLEVAHGGTRQGKALSITVTSCVPGEGKSFVASNLALLFASFSRKVLLVDADLRKPSISKAYQCDTHYGLRDILRADVWNDDFVLRTSVPNLSVLPAGLSKENSSNGIDASKMPALIKDIAQHYDVVIFDTPPVLALADVCVLAATTDVTLLVVRSRKSTLVSVERGAGVLYSMKARALLAVVNDVDESDARGETYYYAQYGYAVNKEPGCENIVNDPVTINLESPESQRGPVPAVPVEHLPLPRIAPVDLASVRKVNSVSGRFHGSEKAPASMLHLESSEVSFELADCEAPCAVGSNRECYVCIDHAEVADRHAEFLFHGGNWLVRDADSGYPTYVNGRAAHSPVALKNGDTIELGKLRMVARVASVPYAPRFGQKDMSTMQMPGETA